MNELSFYLANAVFNQPWLIEKRAFATMNDIVLDRIRGEKRTREGVGECGEKVEFDGMEIDERGVARIPINGVIVTDPQIKVRGIVDTSDIMSELEDAEINDSVERIELHIDSPGGMVRGTPELADAIFRIEKPIRAVVRGMAASAAYWIAAATDEIVAPRTAEIGSIGVIITTTDLSKMYEKAGVEVKVFASGDLKGAGVPGTSLTEAQSEYLEERVAETFRMFRDHVTEMRGELPEEVFRGQTFMGSKALELGLIDSVIS